MTSSPGVGLAVEPEHLRAVGPLRRAERHDLALARHVGHRHELGEVDAAGAKSDGDIFSRLCGSCVVLLKMSSSLSLPARAVGVDAREDLVEARPGHEIGVRKKNSTAYEDSPYIMAQL